MSHLNYNHDVNSRSRIRSVPGNNGLPEISSAIMQPTDQISTAVHTKLINNVKSGLVTQSNMMMRVKVKAR